MAKTVKPAVTKAAAGKPPLKKTAAKRAQDEKGEMGIKYSDKSAGQPQLIPIFNEIKKRLLPYVKGAVTIRGGSGGQVALVSEKPVEINGRKKDELWFAGALIQKGYVGFYFMPVYTTPEIKQVFKPELLKCLKGKSCFHIKKFDAEIFKQIEEALAAGYRNNKEKGWL